MAVNNLKHIRYLLYRLKRVWGKSIRIYSPTKNSLNLKTGKVEKDYRIIYVKRAIVMPNTTKTNSHENPGLADLFDRGGFFDRSERVVIIDAADLPSDYTPNEADHIEYDNHRAQVKEISEAENGRGYALKISEVPDASRVNIPEDISNTFNLTHTASRQ